MYIKIIFRNYFSNIFFSWQILRQWGGTMHRVSASHIMRKECMHEVPAVYSIRKKYIVYFRTMRIAYIPGGGINAQCVGFAHTVREECTMYRVSASHTMRMECMDEVPAVYSIRNKYKVYFRTMHITLTLGGN